MRTQGQSLFTKHRLVFSSIYGLPVASGYGKGFFWNPCFSVAPAPGSPAVPAAGCAGLRVGASPGGHCSPPRGGTGERGGVVVREQRGQKDKGSARSNGGEARMGGQRKGGCWFFFFLSFYYPRVTRKESKEPQSKGCNTRVAGGGKVFLSLDKPRSFGYGFPLLASICPTAR